MQDQLVFQAMNDEKLKYHERIKLIQNHKGCSWVEAQNLYGDHVYQGGPNPFPPDFQVPEDWYGDRAKQELAREEEGIHVGVKSGRNVVPVKHVQMAAWLVRQVGSVDAALAAVKMLAVEEQPESDESQ